VYICLTPLFYKPPRARAARSRRSIRERTRKKKKKKQRSPRARTHSQRERENWYYYYYSVENFPHQRVKVLTKSVASTGKIFSSRVKNLPLSSRKVFLLTTDARKKSRLSSIQQKKEIDKKNVIGRRKRREEHKRFRFRTIASRIRVVYWEIFSFVKF